MSTLFSLTMNVGIFVMYLVDYVYLEVPSRGQQIDVFAAICSIVGAVAIFFVAYHMVRATQIDPEDRIIPI